MIFSFRCKETEKVWHRRFSKKFPADLQVRARRKLIALHIAASLNDLRRPPSNHLEALKKDRQGQWSIPINKQWGACFVWAEGNAHDVEIVDYH
ncbi:MAG: type II toxin-antitoxin system RelE/ParE family toxin [SAR324 cluster bacterium]|nr:type II toxin-antitoxin system RelE/ParE family toxin [SAR324 cluster bacterium]